MYKGPLYNSCQPCPCVNTGQAPGASLSVIGLQWKYMKKSATGLNIYDSEKIGPQAFICPHPVAIYMYIAIILKHLRKCLANLSQILYETFIRRRNETNVYMHENQGHMTKMSTMPIYGKTQLLFFCPVTVLVDSQVSDRCPWVTCLFFPDYSLTGQRFTLRTEQLIKCEPLQKQRVKLWPCKIDLSPPVILYY